MEMKALWTAGLFLLTVFVAGYLVTHQGSMAPVLVLAIVGATVLITRPPLLLILMVCAGASCIRVPGIFELVSLREALFAVAILYGVANYAVSKSQRARDLSDWGLMVFGLTLGVIIMAHGFGMRITGSASYGGKNYVILFLAIVAYRAVQNIQLTPSQVRTLVFCLLAAAAVPVMAQGLIYLIPALYGFVDAYVDTSGYYLLAQGGSQLVEHARWQAMSGFAGIFWMVAMAAFAMTRKRGRLLVALAISVVICQLSGFRGATGALVVMSVAAFVLTGRDRVIVLIGLGMAAIMGYGVLLLVGEHLPYVFQRAMSFLPGIAWDSSVMRDTASSWTWRLDVWKICLPHLHENLLIGRGLLLENVLQHAWLQSSYYSSPEFFYAMHGYHSGPLSLLLDTGIPGFIGFLMVQIGIVTNAFRYWNRTTRSTNRFLRGFLLALLIQVSYGLLTFYLVFGDIVQTLPNLLISGILIHVVGGTLVRDLAAKEAPPAVAPALVAQPHMAPAPGSLEYAG